MSRDNRGHCIEIEEEFELLKEKYESITDRLGESARHLWVIGQQNKKYKKALEQIINIDGLFLDEPFNADIALNTVDEIAKRVLENK